MRGTYVGKFRSSKYGHILPDHGRVLHSSKCSRHTTADSRVRQYVAGAAAITVTVGKLKFQLSLFIDAPAKCSRQFRYRSLKHLWRFLCDLRIDMLLSRSRFERTRRIIPKVILRGFLEFHTYTTQN